MCVSHVSAVIYRFLLFWCLVNHFLDIDAHLCPFPKYVTIQTCSVNSFLMICVAIHLCWIMCWFLDLFWGTVLLKYFMPTSSMKRIVIVKIIISSNGIIIRNKYFKKLHQVETLKEIKLGRSRRLKTKTWKQKT